MLWLLPLTAFAAPIKVGVVDFDKLFKQTETARVDKAELDSLLRKKQVEVDVRKSALETSRRELASAPRTLDGVVRARREAELDAEAASLKKLFQDAQAFVDERERELTQRMLADAKAIAPSVAQEKGITLVLGAAEALLWSAPSVIQIDLTGEIGRALDRRLGTRTDQN
jgi:outer membrane protein